MRTLLTLEKYDRGMLLEKREQWAKSWTQQLWELLYIAHAQIAKAAPRIATDIIGQQREIDSQANVSTGKEYKSTLAVGAPSGAGGLFCPTGSWQTEDGYEFSVVRPTNFIRGELVGIQAGAGTSAVIPTDTRLAQRINHGQGGSIAITQSFDSYTSGDDGEDGIYGTERIYSVGILPVRGFRLSAVRLLLYRVGTPGTITLSIRGLRGELDTYGRHEFELTPVAETTSDGNTLPTGAPHEWREFTLPAPIDIPQGYPFSVALMATSGDSSNYVRWRRHNRGSGNQHPRYWQINTTNGGGSFNQYSYYTPMFELRGMALAELEHGGCEIFGLNLSHPNGQFNIRRLFTNNSGETVNINEVGIYAVGTRVGWYSRSYCFVGDAYSFCIARDIVSPAINLLDGQVLQVTYTPQITV